MIQYTVKNWERFQHYKDRNPPWIKLHFEILASADWVMLADASKLLMVVCMMIASRNKGMIPADAHYFKRVAYLDKLPDFKPLLDCGFLEKSQATARPETEEEKKEEKSTKKEIPEGFDNFFSIFPNQRKGNREKAEAAYRQALTRSTPLEILIGLKSYIDSDEVKKGFAKGAAAWLNDDRWTINYSKGNNHESNSKINGFGNKPDKSDDAKSAILRGAEKLGITAG